MENLVGKITASLAEKESIIPDELVARINSNIKPPSPVSADDVYVRAMYILSDQINSFGGCFPSDEHHRLTELLIDSPVLIGHRKDSLPIARNFHAEKVVRDDSNWVKVFFYWLKSADKAEDLRNNIDGGIYKECSISFIFGFPECSICGSDIRQCRHRPFEKYEVGDGEEREAHFNYRQILKVLETSLVYRGSVQDTSITDELYFFKSETGESDEGEPERCEPVFKRLWDLGCLDVQKSYFVAPAYEALRIRLEKSGIGLKPYSYQGNELTCKRVTGYLESIDLPAGSYALDCRLIGLRGKERQSVSELGKFLKGEKSTVRRIEIKVADVLGCESKPMTGRPGRVRRNLLEDLFQANKTVLIPTDEVLGAELVGAVQKKASRYGAEIFDADAPDRYLFTHRRVIPLKVAGKRQEREGFTYSLTAAHGTSLMTVSSPVVSKEDWLPGDVIELEVCAAHRVEGAIELVYPEVVDYYGDSSEPDEIGLLLKQRPEQDSSSRYEVFNFEDNSILLTVGSGDDRKSFLIRRFSDELLEKGRRFLADIADSRTVQPGQPGGMGTVSNVVCVDGALLYVFSGFFKGEFRIRPALINGVSRRLFYRVNSDHIVGDTG
ncbi:MAG: hypothetical protein JSU69_09855 [Candidatus Zixiibacteriota bacterium]|nr:MAG: hypothetical protein JSU69_09855 [candidate division Zixibacteria bacterium]